MTTASKREWEDNVDDNDNDDNDSGLNDNNGMSEYELKRMGNIARNNARLASLGLLVPMTSAATLSSNLSNRKKRLISPDNVERRIQPKRNAKQLTSYRDFNDDNEDDGDELDSDTIDSVLLSEEESDLNVYFDDSHDELDINTNDLSDQTQTHGDETSKKRSGHLIADGTATASQWTRKAMRRQRKAPSCSPTTIAMAPRSLWPW